MPGASEHSRSRGHLDRAEAEVLATSMRAFAAGSRIQLLWALIDGERTVEELEAATGLSQSLVSQQLRVLRDLRFVTVRRAGRHGYYRLHDHHIPELLAAVRHHREHVDGIPDPAVRAVAE